MERCGWLGFFVEMWGDCFLWFFKVFLIFWFFKVFLVLWLGLWWKIFLLGWMCFVICFYVYFGVLNCEELVVYLFNWVLFYVLELWGLWVLGFLMKSMWMLKFLMRLRCSFFFVCLVILFFISIISEVCFGYGFMV